ncbi:MAG TPA: hypothetical protein VGO19_09485 [Actinomycetes bacterium]|jgi:drug/metabolite transporter (DMT)-like permease
MLLSTLIPLAAVFEGVSLVVQRHHSVESVVSGLVLALVGVAVCSSYALRFSSILVGDAWTTTPVRRTTRMVLLYSWNVYFGALPASAPAAGAWSTRTWPSDAERPPFVEPVETR